MFVFNLFENKEQEPNPVLPVVKEDSWHDGSTAWSSEHDQWAKESQGDTQLSVGDPIIVTAPNEYEGKTGEIAEFSPSGKFVVVNLYNHGEHSMHLSDVEYNKYADDEVDEGYASVIGLNPKSLDPVSQWKISVRQLVADYIKDPQSLYNLAKQKGSNSAEAMAYKYIMHPSGKIELPPDAMTNEQDVAENSDSSPVAGAVTRRILQQRLDLLKQYGPELVGAAVDNVADYVGDVEEIGSSDVSGWVAQVERMLKENPPEAFDEGFQDFNKVEPYAVCLAGKPVKQFDYYEQARRFHDNWKQKLYREGDKAKADTITLMPLNLDEMDKSQTPPGRAGDYPLGVKGTTGKPVTAKKVVKDLTKDLDQAFGKEKKVKEEAGRVDPILIKALNRMPDGLASHGEVLNACYDAYAMELGRMEMKSNYGTTHAYVPQLMDLYKQKHGLTFKETVLNPRDLAGDLAAKRKALQDLSMNKDVDQQAVQQRKLDLDKEARAKGMAEAQTDYQKRRQRERDVDAGRPVKALPKNPQTDYAKKRAKEKRDLELGEAPVTKKPQPYNDPDWHKSLSPEQLRKLTGPKHTLASQRKKPVKENYWTRLQNERNTKVAGLVNELTESVKDIK